MQAAHPTKEMLSEAIEQASRLALEKLFRDHKEGFYYVSLITTGEAHAPFISAWSKEALAKEALRQGVDAEDLKWSYADSPYSIYGEEFFGEVNRLFGQRPRMTHMLTDAEWATEFEFRVTAMEEAMRRLDTQGLFGVLSERAKLVINVEVMPPDRTNTERARRLNPPKALVDWLSEAAEDDA